MRVSLLSNLFPPNVIGGAELSAYFTSLELVRRGHEVSVITTGDADSVSTEEGMRIHRIKARPLYSPYVAKQQSKWIKPFWHLADLYNPLMSSRVSEALAAEKPEVAHYHNIVGFSCAVWESARSLGIPVVQHFHDYHLICIKATLMDEHLNACPTPHFPCNYRALHHFRMLGGKVGRVISPSRFCADTIFARLPLGSKAPKVDVIPNGTDYSGRDPVIGDWRGEKFRVLFLGALFKHKGFRLLMEIVEAVNRGPNPFEFHIGGKGPMEAEAKSLAAAHPNVHYHGFVSGEGKLKLFREAHLFFFPSVWLENNPVSITEALALGLPVLGSEVGGVPELLAPVSRDLLFTPGSVSEAVARLTAWEKDREGLAAVSRALLAGRNRYGIREQVDQTLRVYQEAADEMRTGASDFKSAGRDGSGEGARGPVESRS